MPARPDPSSSNLSRRNALRVVGGGVVGLTAAATAAGHAEYAPIDYAAVAPAAAPSANAHPEWQQAFSKPSQERRLPFAAPGIVSQVVVEEGDVVKAGQLLAKQDDRLEQAALRSLQIDAESKAEIEYSEADQADKRVKRDRKIELARTLDASKSEVEEAELAVKLAAAQVLVSTVKFNKANAELAREQVKVDQMQMFSPIDGIVQAINTHVGEWFDPQIKESGIQVVKNDPLYVEMDVPTAAAAKLRVGQALDVGYWAGSPGGVGAVNDWQPAKITYFDPTANASGGTERVRLTLPNPSGQRSGLEMRVRLPADAAAALADAAGVQNQ